MFHVKQNKTFDVVVVGAGHAGVEAATMSSRLGMKTALVTFNKNDIGTLSCNPAMGGLGKGHLIREIDALGGLIGRSSDLSGIQFRVLNKTRGEAVQGPRAQIDRDKYRKNMLELLDREDINFILDEVTDIKISKEHNKKVIRGLTLRITGDIFCRSLVITTGTFLGGMIYRGKESWSAGRIGANPSIRLSNFFKLNEFKMLRLKTGTPPRLCGNSIIYKDCIIQRGDKIPEPFSFLTDKIKTKQIDCYITHTNQKTHKIIKDNLNNSPMFDGTIKSKGPRYCPSVEDKISRFSFKDSHQIFLEPETLDGTTIYPNGISTSLPKTIQDKFIYSIKGLENAVIKQHGYSIEYDCVDSIEIKKSFETKKISGLFLAGQINGTTGYEEAAAQGLMAGINAAYKILDKKSLVISRSQGYLGVLTSDLTKGGLIEPYRMFTSRAEYRLLLRADNADERLTDLGIKSGFIEKERKIKWLAKKSLLNKTYTLLNNLTASPQEYSHFNIKINQDGKKRTAFEILGYKDVTWKDLKKMWPEIEKLKTNQVIEKQIKANSFYERYSSRQKLEIEELEKDRYLKIDHNINFLSCSGLSNEVKEILNLHKPENIMEARQLPGMTPAAASILLRFIKK